ncbi:MAG: hypothetical protein RR218_06485, partial [Gordonibacter sp.]
MQFASWEAPFLRSWKEHDREARFVGTIFRLPKKSGLRASDGCSGFAAPALLLLLSLTQKGRHEVSR